MMNIEKFIDRFGDDVYALALVCTKNFDSAADIFSAVASECEDMPDDSEMFDLAKKVCSMCKAAKFSDNAETFSQLGLSEKQEMLLSGFFPKPFVTRASVHLYYENDLTEEQIAEVLEEKRRYISEQLDGLGTELQSELDGSYKELCLKLAAPDELKTKAIEAAKSGEKRQFEILDDPVPKHTWSKKQKIATIIVAIIATFVLMFVIPIANKLMDDYLAGGSYDDTPSELVFSGNTESAPEYDD